VNARPTPRVNDSCATSLKPRRVTACTSELTSLPRLKCAEFATRSTPVASPGSMASASATARMLTSSDATSERTFSAAVGAGGIEIWPVSSVCSSAAPNSSTSGSAAGAWDGTDDEDVVDGAVAVDGVGASRAQRLTCWTMSRPTSTWARPIERAASARARLKATCSLVSS